MIKIIGCRFNIVFSFVSLGKEDFKTSKLISQLHNCFILFILSWVLIEVYL